MSSSAGNSLTAQAERERRQRELARASASGGARAGPPPSSSTSSRAVIAPSAAAEALTRLEVNRTAARNYSTSAGASGFTDDASLVGKLYVDDPVWGRWIHDGPPGSKPTCSTMCCLSCCPCFVPPLKTPSRTAARARVFRTSAFWLSMIQIILVIVSLSFRGFAPYELNFGLGPWVDTLDYLGAKNGAKIVRLREAWRLLVAIMLHNGLLHLATNLLMQLRLGVLAEITWGMQRFLPLYIGAGVMGSLFSTVVLPDAIGVGASGALCGVLGAWVMFLAFHWGHGTEEMQQKRKSEICMTLVNVAILFATSFIPNIDWAAHLGGLIGGMLLGMWYFGPALGGEAYAYDTLSRAAAERKVAAAAHALALADGATTAPPLPTHLRGTRASPGGGGAPQSPPSNVIPLVSPTSSGIAGGGGVGGVGGGVGGTAWGTGGRRLDGQDIESASATTASKHSGETCASCAGACVDNTAALICGPMPSILDAFKVNAPRGLYTGAMISLFGLFGFMALTCVLIGLIYGGFISTNPSLLNVCPLISASYPSQNLKCPY